MEFFCSRILSMIRELETEELRLSEPSCSFADIVAGTAITGQEKAISLLRLGLSIDRVGYNIFLSGDDGSGRLTAVLEELKKLPEEPRMIRDAAYVWSGESQSIRVLLFPSGEASAFQKDLLSYGRGGLQREDLLRRWPERRIELFIDSLPPFGEIPEAYRINIVIDHSQDGSRPAIIETHPSHQSLFGLVEHKKASGRRSSAILS